MEMRYGSLYQTKEKERLYDESLLISLFFSPIPQSFHQLYLSLDISFSLYISLPLTSLPPCSLVLFPRIIFLLPRVFLFSSYYFSLSSLLFPKSFPVYVSKPFSTFLSTNFSLCLSLHISPAIYLL